MNSLAMEEFMTARKATTSYAQPGLRITALVVFNAIVLVIEGGDDPTLQVNIADFLDDNLVRCDPKLLGAGGVEDLSVVIDEQLNGLDLVPPNVLSANCPTPVPPGQTAWTKKPLVVTRSQPLSSFKEVA